MTRRFPYLTGKLAIAASLAALAAACSGQQPTQPLSSAPLFSQRGAQTTTLDRHVVVMNGSIRSDFASRVQALGGSVTATYPEIGVAVTSGLTDAAAAKLARAPGVAGVDRDALLQWIPVPDNAIVQRLQAPTEQTDQSGATHFSDYQWNLRQIAADQAWLTTNQGSGARVAILDTGIDPYHVDLAGKVDPASTSVLTPGSSPCGSFDESTIYDLNFHGSFVAGLIASNGIDMASVAPDARLVAVKVLNCYGYGYIGDIIAGILYATSENVDVINMSFGVYFPKDSTSYRHLVAAMNRATTYANRHGVVVVAAAGNEGVDLQHDKNYVSIPAQSANVFSVGATAPFDQTNFDALASYTNFGVSGVTEMAPGGDYIVPGGQLRDLVLSVCSSFVCGVTDGYALGDGTSFAAPHVSGAAAVVKSQFPDASASQIEHCLLKGADDLGKPGVDQMYSHGRLNVLKAATCG